MHYKLVVTDEMDRLLDERVGYLIKEFKSNQAASHLLDGIEEIYDYLETNPEIQREPGSIYESISLSGSKSKWYGLYIGL